MLLEIAFAETPRERRMVVIYVRQKDIVSSFYLATFAGRNMSMLLEALLGFSLLDLIVFLITSHRCVFVQNFSTYPILCCGFLR